MKGSGKALFSLRFWLWIIVFLVGLGLGYRIAQYNLIGLASRGGQVRQGSGSYSFINPLLACLSPGKELFPEYLDLGKKLKSLVNDRIQRGDAKKIGVYFRDLTTGHWTGVNESEKFVPASLYKVVVMVALFRQAEVDPGLLEKQIVYEKPTDLEGAARSSLQVGNTYTVAQLIEAMIKDSDNNAKDLLEEPTKTEFLQQVLDELNLDVSPALGETEDQGILAPRQYSLLLRVLYNATFLSKDFSERALRILSEAKFDQGISAKLPESLKVARKFGSFTEVKGAQELHECGIIYDPESPYLLCVMTQGESQARLASVIQDLSLDVYKYVNSK